MIKITLVIVSIALFGFGTYYASEAVRIRRRVMSKLSQSSDLSKIYTFRKPSEVSEFLRDNHFLISLLVEAYDNIEAFFPSAELILEVVTDPEAKRDKELVVFIHTSLTPDEALDKLERLDRNWWLDASLDAGGKLCIHLEFE